MMMLRWFAISLLILLLCIGILWLGALSKSQAREIAGQMQAKEMKVPVEEGKEYVLEIIGFGVTLDKYRQAKLWEALKTGSAYTSIREQDPNKYPWTGMDKNSQGGGRACDALENGANFTPMYWGLPSLYAGTPILDPNEEQPSMKNPMAGLVAGASTMGLPFHLFSIGPWKLDERPDRLLTEAFDFFDRHPDVPYVLVHSEDSPGTHDGNRKPGDKKKLTDGYYIPDMPDTTAVFVLARRERVDFLRPFVWEDPENTFLQEKFKAMYYDLKNALATTDKSLGENSFPMSRQPTVNEWLAAAAAFAQRPDIRGLGLHAFDNINPWLNRPPQDWKPTPWFPIPWNREQMETFDRLPSFGFVHRPVFVKFTDAEGKPVTRRDECQKLFNAGWQQALQTLPEVQRSKGPARIVAGTGQQKEQLLMLESMLHEYAAQGGPEIDSGKSTQFINTDLRLGNTGSASWFMQMAIGVMGSYRDGGASAAINLRDRNEASIIFVTPPPDSKRKRQDEGGDIFRSRITPAIDPANYVTPSVEALLQGQAGK